MKKWKYTLHPRSEATREVRENGKRLVTILSSGQQPYVVWESELAGCTVWLDPFVLQFDPHPASLLLEELTVVFVYQEEEL